MDTKAFCRNHDVFVAVGISYTIVSLRCNLAEGFDGTFVISYSISYTFSIHSFNRGGLFEWLFLQDVFIFSEFSTY